MRYSDIWLDKTVNERFFARCVCTQTCVSERVTRLIDRSSAGFGSRCLGTLSFLRAAVFVLDQPKALLLGVGTDSSLDSTFPLVKDWAAEAQIDLSR